jgi:hypothetical protein
MTESEGTVVTPASFTEHLKHLPWCKQGDDVLVAVDKAGPDIIEFMKDREVKVFPGDISVKMQKSVLTHFKQKFDEDEPLSVVIVWRSAGIEIWYRKTKPSEYPYDAWSGGAAAAYEQERVIIPLAELSEDAASVHAELAAKSNACPSMMPPY